MIIQLPDIRKVNLVGKRVLMRVDFNVPFSEGKLFARYKISAIKNTLDFILSHSDVKLALLSHLGRPRGRDKKLSFSEIYSDIAKILGIDLVFVDESFGQKVTDSLDSLSSGQVLMLENVRFFKEDAKGSSEFSKKLASGFDVFVNEAFGVGHRDHCSTTGIVNILPAHVGINFQKEIEELNRLRSGFERPALALIGGAKIETKIPVIEFFAKNYDKILVGGKMGIEAEKNNITFDENVILPEDYEGDGRDIGHQTINKFVRHIADAKTIIWNGPLGLFEEPPYDVGTLLVLDAMIKNKRAFKVAGGGETVQVLEKQKLIKNFNFVSTGGGAMLEFLAKGTLPVIEILKAKK